MSKETYTIEPEDNGRGGTEYWVWGHGEYPRSSVLAGQHRRRRVERYDTIEQAKAAYPQAEALDHSTGPIRLASDSLGDLSGLPSEPPSWFDPMDAGEAWGEDDY